MKKITATHRIKDRIICITTGKHGFYYQPTAAKERYRLSDIADVIFAVGTFFRSKGIRTDVSGFSVTLGDLYRACSHRSRLVAHVLERIPAQVNYVLKYERIAERAA